jgi:transcriptional regulator GlxA family with amidase domain
VRYIEAYAMDPIGLPDIARAAGLSPRALQAAFRRHLGTTPLGYLRCVRLELAHQDLQAAGHDDGETVSEIAGRRGFVQLSRFARDYRERYGELPRRTLADVGP